MNYLIIDYKVLQNKSLTMSDKLVYSYIQSWIRYEGGPEHCCNKSNDFIAKHLGLGVRSVNTSIKHLQELKMIRCVYMRSRGIRSNRFIDFRIEKEKTASDMSLKELFDVVYEKAKKGEL